jgi:hypothetical protein
MVRQYLSALWKVLWSWKGLVSAIAASLGALSKLGFLPFIPAEFWWVLALVVLLGSAVHIQWKLDRALEETRRAFDLRVNFATVLSGCRVELTLPSGQRAVFYRLWVRPPIGQVRTGCTGTLTDIMVPTAGTPGHWHSEWTPERLDLTWATHRRDPETSIDLRDDTGRFLDLFNIRGGNMGLGTPNNLLPLSLNSTEFRRGVPYLFCVSLTCDDHAAQEIAIQVTWPVDPDGEVDVVLVKGVGG